MTFYKILQLLLLHQVLSSFSLTSLAGPEVTSLCLRALCIPSTGDVRFFKNSGFASKSIVIADGC